MVGADTGPEADWLPGDGGLQLRSRSAAAGRGSATGWPALVRTWEDPFSYFSRGALPDSGVGRVVCAEAPTGAVALDPLIGPAGQPELDVPSPGQLGWTDPRGRVPSSATSTASPRAAPTEESGAPRGAGRR